jgi:hypothetical protein
MNHLFPVETSTDVPETVRPKLIALANYLESLWGVRPLWSLRDGQLVGAGIVSIRDDDGKYHFPMEIEW